MPGMFVIRNDGSLMELAEQPYDSEAVLQELLESYPMLLVGEATGTPEARKYVLVRREVPVPENEASAQWSVDHLFLDQEGVPTLVECKRSSNTEIRRAIVGQMFDYAANILSYWNAERIQGEFEARCAEKDVDPESALREISDDDYADYWTRVETNLAARRLRLVFVADVIPPNLQAIVEFLYEQMDPTEVIAVEVKQHVGEGLKTMVTQIMGPSASALQAKTSSPARRWDEASFFAEIESLHGPTQAAASRAVFDWARDRGLTIRWGAGAKEGWVTLLLVRGGREIKPFGLVTDGQLALYPGSLGRVAPFDSEDALQGALDRFREIPGVSIPPEAIAWSYKKIEPSVLADSNTLKACLVAMAWVLDQLEAANPG